MATISTKELEERSKKIFNALGLKDLDIKIVRDDNGKKSSEHIHVDQNGSSVESSKTPEGNKTNSSNSTSASEKELNRTKEAIDTFFKWISGDIEQPQMFNNLKSLFEEKCLEKYGNLDIDNLVKDIDEHAKNMMSGTWGQVTKRLNELGFNLTPEDFSKAAEELKRIWGYGGGKTSPIGEKRDSEKEQVSKPAEPKAPKSKAEQIKEMLKEQRDKEEANKKVIFEIVEKINSAIMNREFESFNDGDDAGEAIGIMLYVDTRYCASEEILSDLVFKAAKSVKDDYGFSNFTVVPPCKATNNRWRIKYWF